MADSGIRNGVESVGGMKRVVSLLAAAGFLAAAVLAAGSGGGVATAASGDTCSNAAFRTGASASLPDCRAYEMVSPVDKNSADVTTLCNINCFRTSLLQSTPDGSKLSYSAYKGFGDVQSALYSNQYIASRGAGGWSTHSINPPQQDNVSWSRGYDTVYDTDIQIKALSEDLSTAALVNDARPVLTPDGAEQQVNIYVRNNESDTYQWATGLGELSETYLHNPDLEALSANGEHLIFSVNLKLTPDAAPTGSGFQVYDYSGGQVHLVSLLPDNTPVEGGAAAGDSEGDESGRERNLMNAVSRDGSRVIWSAGFGLANRGALYERINNSETKPVSGITGASEATFWTASTDGKKVLYTAGSGGGPLYRVDVDAATSTLIASETDGVLGASDDLSQVYFVSREELASGAVAGEPNLYRFHDGVYDLVATVSPTDIGLASEINEEGEPAVSGYDIGAVAPLLKAARVSPDGLGVAFQSVASLTGYDNRDVKNNERDLEVYVYDAATKKLSCASCRPSGTRPDGRPLQVYDRSDFEEVTNGGGGTPRRWTAAWLQTAESQTYLPRDLTDDGNKVFFNAFDALLPQDNNQKQDVYEWEAQGSGGCTQAGGCLSLISTGESPKNSEFVDASASGSDVFFKTFSSLVPQDRGLLDIYDAKEGGGFDLPTVEEAPCEGDACQTAPAAPNDPTPASAAYNGPGNVREALKKKRSRHHKRHHRRHHREHKAKHASKSPRGTRTATNGNG
jgi:hypothetical protein